MRLSLTILLLCLSSVVFAQGEFGGKTIKMPKSSGNITPLPNPEPAKPKNPFSGEIPDMKPSRTINPEPANSNFGKAPTVFVDPNQDVLKKLNKQSYQVYDVNVKRDQFLGEIRTRSKVGRILYRDYDRVDGDAIRIYVNGTQTQPQIILDGEFEGFDITFVEGTNMIEFESLSEGYAPPNTAELVVLDESGAVLFQNGWAIANGFKASINIIREP